MTEPTPTPPLGPRDKRPDDKQTSDPAGRPAGAVPEHRARRRRRLIVGTRVGGVIAVGSVIVVSVIVVSVIVVSVIVGTVLVTSVTTTGGNPEHHGDWNVQTASDTNDRTQPEDRSLGGRAAQLPGNAPSSTAHPHMPSKVTATDGDTTIKRNHGDDVRRHNDETLGADDQAGSDVRTGEQDDASAVTDASTAYAGDGTPNDAAGAGETVTGGTVIGETTTTKIVTMIEPADLAPGDPAYPWVVWVDRLRLDAEAAVRRAEISEARARAANERERRARYDANVAASRADHLQRSAERWAIDLYTSDLGRNPGIDVIDMALDDPTRSIDMRIWATVIEQEQAHRVELAATARKESLHAQTRAQNARREVETAMVTAREQRANALMLLDEAQTAVEQLLGQTVSYQIVVDADGCPTSVPDNTLRGNATGLDIYELCRRNVASAPNPETALAVKYAFRALGAAYACDGLGRNQPFRYDCSSLVTRAYAEGAGLATAMPGRIPSTRSLIPWGGGRLVDWAPAVLPVDSQPGDLVFYDTGHETVRHVVLLLADDLMLHVSTCGDVVHITDFWGWEDKPGRDYLLTRRVDVEAARWPTGFDPSSILQDSQNFPNDPAGLADLSGDGLGPTSEQGLGERQVQTPGQGPSGRFTDHRPGGWWNPSERRR